MRLFFLALLLTTLSFANEYKKVAIIPANINYNKEAAQEFSEILYDSVVNAVAEYNFSQTLPSNMYQLKGPLLAQKKYAVQIKDIHKEVKEAAQLLMVQHKLDKLLVMDFSTNRVVRTMKRCKNLCDVKISFLEFSLGKEPLSKDVTYQFDASSCLLSDSSTDALNSSMTSYLSK